nr:thiosulfate oxidation carrier complex protein SoxZ [Indioceanicola profundi]
MSKARVRLPSKAKKGEVIEIKTLINHTMESGQRKDSAGNPIPRQIINKMTATFNGKEILNATLHPGVSANPYISFFTKVEESGTFEFVWHDDDGSTVKETAKITVG